MAKFLTVFGFIWLLVGNIFGLFLARRHDQHLAEVDDLPAGSTEHLAELYQRDWAYRWNKTCHAHVSLFSVVCVLVGLMLHLFAIPPGALVRLTVMALISAVVLWTLFSFRMVKPAMAVADMLFFASVAAATYLLLVAAPGPGA